MNGNLSNKDVLYVHVMILDMKRTISHHAVIITKYAIWHQYHLKAYIIEYY